MTFDLKELHAPFPREAISWRAQNIKKDGSAALALAYIDARDVMDRLDAVVGPENWSDSYDVHEHVTICSIAIRTPDGWVSKADGAGDTDVEAEKGRISDAFKRAAVRWGIGRYLYSITSPWVPCESYDSGSKDKNGNTIWRWRRWTVDPWSMVKGHGASPEQPKQESAPVMPEGPQPRWSKADPEKRGRNLFERLTAALRDIHSAAGVENWSMDPRVDAALKQLPEDWEGTLRAEILERFESLRKAEAEAEQAPT